ncbi:hypothetical protein [Shimia sp. MIT1388]|uniref:hypothetical protein n=1 Tax=Shimia sp. MIT1388 TaxID=3096992 RepID=UPI00399A8EFF
MLQQHKETASIYAYVLLTHGPKPKGSIENHPAARQQISNLRGAALEFESLADLRIAYDYARSFSKLADLPNFLKLLKAFKKHNGTVLIDDFRRLFANHSGDDRAALLDELLDFKENIRDLKTSKLLGELSQTQVTLICAAESPVKFARTPAPRAPRAKDERQLQTQKAVDASRKVRSSAADAKARELAELRDRLAATSNEVSNRQLADAANAEGLRTTRGKLWKPAGVNRMLKRLGG